MIADLMTQRLAKNMHEKWMKVIGMSDQDGNTMDKSDDFRAVMRSWGVLRDERRAHSSQ